MKVGLTGGSGFLGSHLQTYLISLGHEVFSFNGDICNFSEINEFCLKYKFESIVHLAGISNIADADSNIQKLFEVNVLGTANVIEATKNNNPSANFIFASTAQVYAPPTSKKRIQEYDIVKPQNLYARSKLMGEKILESYVETGLLKGTILRIFNHTHKTQPDKAFLPVVYKQCLSAHDKGEQFVRLSLGNIDLERDLSPVKNFSFLVEKIISKTNSEFKVNKFNICGGEGFNLRDVINSFAEHMNLKLEINIDPAKIRASDPMFVVGDNTSVFKYLEIPKPQNSIEGLIKGFFE